MNYKTKSSEREEYNTEWSSAWRQPYWWVHTSRTRQENMDWFVNKWYHGRVEWCNKIALLNPV